MAKSITRIVLTGGPAAGKTTLISRVIKEFKKEDGWRVITIPETATELISGFGIGPFPGCMSMEMFQYFVIADQLHKEQLALKAAETVPEEKVIIIYDRAVFDDKAYITPEEFRETLAYFGKTEEELLSGYDAVMHLVTCAKGAEYAYNFGNAARYESVEDARRMDDRTIEAWSAHPHVHIIDNSVDFEDKINRAITKIYQILGEPAPEIGKHKYLVSMPDCDGLCRRYNAQPVEIMQTYLLSSDPALERRVRLEEFHGDKLYFYIRKRIAEDGTRWVTEQPINEKEYLARLNEADLSIHTVHKLKFRFSCDGRRMAVDVYPFSGERAILYVYGSGEGALPPEIEVICEVTDNPDYRNRTLAIRHSL